MIPELRLAKREGNAFGQLSLSAHHAGVAQW